MKQEAPQRRRKLPRESSDFECEEHVKNVAASISFLPEEHAAAWGVALEDGIDADLVV
jgi:hypothetical protein